MDKGFGFIEPDDGGNDVFVHVSVPQRCGLISLREDQIVEFETEISHRTGKPAVTTIKLA